MDTRRQSSIAAASAALIMIALFFSGCASSLRKPEDDPLKYTKKLVVQGHVSLYEN